MEPTLDPKKAAGAQKPHLQNIPPALNIEVAKAIECGAKKYGPWNWRDNNVELMTYLGAMKRHIDVLIEGEDIDPESGAHHLGHVAAGCAIVLDARKHGTLVDNRPPAKVNNKMLPAKSECEPPPSYPMDFYYNGKKLDCVGDNPYVLGGRMRKARVSPVAIAIKRGCERCPHTDTCMLLSERKLLSVIES